VKFKTKVKIELEKEDTKKEDKKVGKDAKR